MNPLSNKFSEQLYNLQPLQFLGNPVLNPLEKANKNHVPTLFINTIKNLSPFSSVKLPDCLANLPQLGSNNFKTTQLQRQHYQRVINQNIQSVGKKINNLIHGLKNHANFQTAAAIGFVAFSTCALYSGCSLLTSSKAPSILTPPSAPSTASLSPSPTQLQRDHIQNAALNLEQQSSELNIFNFSNLLEKLQDIALNITISNSVDVQNFVLDNTPTSKWMENVAEHEKSTNKTTDKNNNKMKCDSYFESKSSMTIVKLFATVYLLNQYSLVKKNRIVNSIKKFIPFISSINAVAFMSLITGYHSYHHGINMIANVSLGLTTVIITSDLIENKIINPLTNRLDKYYLREKQYGEDLMKTFMGPIIEDFQKLKDKLEEDKKTKEEALKAKRNLQNPRCLATEENTDNKGLGRLPPPPRPHSIQLQTLAKIEHYF